MADAAQQLARLDSLAGLYRHAPRCEVREGREHAVAAQEHVVAEDARQSGWPERDRVVDGMGELADRVQPPAFGHPVDGPDDLASHRRVDRSAPGVAVARPPPDEQAAPSTGRMRLEPGPIVDAEEVVRVPLAEHVDPVARDAIRRAGDRDPVLAAQREVDHDGVRELGGRTPARGRRCGL